MVKGLTVALLLALAGCQTTSGGSFCALSDPIRLSAETVDRLPDEKVNDILAHNEKGERLCGWKP